MPQQQTTTQDSALLLHVGKGKYRACQSFAECQEVVNLITAHIGSGEYYRMGIGTILHYTKGIFAHVSYNGKVWKGCGNTLADGAEEIINLYSNDF